MNLFIVVASIVIIVIAVVILLFLGFKFPRGRADWPYDRSETTRYVITGILFLMILGLIYWITRYWDYPVGGKALAYVSFIGIIVLFVLGLLFPSGRRGDWIFRREHED